MSDLQQRVYLLKLSILKDLISKDIDAKKNEKTDPVAAVVVDRTEEALDRITKLLQEKQEAKAVEPDQKPVDIMQLLQTITLQNAQLHGIIMANMLQNNPIHVNNTENAKNSQESRVEREKKVRIGSITSLYPQNDKYTRDRYKGSSETISTLNTTNYIDRRGSLLPRSFREPEYTTKSTGVARFRCIAISVLFVQFVIQDGYFFATVPGNVSQVHRKAETQFIEYIKTRKEFSNICSHITKVSQQGVHFTVKETFKIMSSSEKRIVAIETFLDLLESLTFISLSAGLGAGSEFFRVLNYFCQSFSSLNSVTWNIEKNILQGAVGTPVTSNIIAKRDEKISAALVAFFMAKCMSKLFLNPNSYSIAKKNNLTEKNFACLSLFIIRAVMYAFCNGGGNDGEEQCEEYFRDLPRNVSEARQILSSTGLTNAIIAAGTRIKTWSFSLLQASKTR